RRVVRPDLLLVAEGGGRLLGDDLRARPGALGAGGRRGDIIGAGDADPDEPAEALGPPAAEVGCEVRVIQPFAVGPREATVGVGLRPERQRGVAVRRQALLVVVRHGLDRSYRRGARRIRVPHDALASACGEARVRGLGPGGTGVEGEVHTGGADARGERTRRVVAGVARLEVDVVVGAGGEDVRLVRVDRDRRLVLLVLRERARRAADAYPRVGVERRR